MSDDRVIVGMESMTYRQAEQLVAAVHEARHGVNSWHDLDVVARDAMIRALRERADDFGIGVAICA